MALNWIVLVIGMLALATIPGIIILFKHNTGTARRIIWLTLGVLAVLHGLAWMLGEHYLQNSN